MLLSESYDSADMFRTFHRKPHHGEFSQQSVSDWHMGSLLVLTLSLASRRRQIRNALIPRPLFARFSHKTRCGDNPPATEAQRTLNCKNDFFLDRRRQQPRRRRRDDQQTDGRTERQRLPAPTSACCSRRGAPPLRRPPLSHRPFPRSAAAGIRGGGAAGRAIGERRAEGRGWCGQAPQPWQGGRLRPSVRV